MFVSIIIPTIRETLLAKVLPAVLSQDYPEDRYEVLVIEDGTKSKVKELVDSLSVSSGVSPRYFWQKHGGPAKARNFGISQAAGEVVAFIDDDCLPPRNWLSLLIAGFAEYPEAVAVGGYMEAPEALLVNNVFAQFEAYQTHQVYKAGSFPVLAGFDCPAGGSNNLAYRKNVFLEFGGFDESFPLPAGEDADLKKRVADAGYKFLYLPIKVTHLQQYNLKRFVRQSVMRGRGAVLFERKHGGWEGVGGLALSLIYGGLSFTRNLVKIPNKKLAFLYLIQDLLMWWGRLLLVIGH